MKNSMGRALALFLLSVLVLTGANLGQEPDAAEAELQAKITKYLGLAQNGRAAVRPQAARRLVKLGEPAAKRVLAACGENGTHMAAMGPSLVEVLADFGEPALRSMLWQSLADLDFPWRGPAARGLSHAAQAEEFGRFVKLCEDRLDQVRLAGVTVLGESVALGLDPRKNRAFDLLVNRARKDPSDRVRRAAAAQLDEWGEHQYLLWLVEDLRRDDTYFRLPLGEQARFASIRILKTKLGSDFGFKAEDSPLGEDNARAIEELRVAVSRRFEGSAPELPDLALAGSKIEGNLIGLELRSCRVGEFFLRWNRDDVLYVGTGRPRAISLEPGTVARLATQLEECVLELGETRYWGEAGCDIEQLRLLDGEGSVRPFLISKGQAAVEDLRPAPLDRAVALLVASIPEGAAPWGRVSPADASTLRGQVREALFVLGGEF